jgi:glycosyltransferase involved in cell wall biosynthesis
MSAAAERHPADLDATILICTYNRAEDLATTLDSIARLRVPAEINWELLVVDNNSTDSTRQVVAQRIPLFPAALRYLFEPKQGKSTALNSGMAQANGRIIVFTDDDVRVPQHWLEAAIRPLLDDPTLDYTGGPVRPIWGGARPEWLDETGNLGGTIAVKDHGSAPFVFEEHRKTPLGVNMAVRRTLIDAIGGFNAAFGRTGQSLLGQEQAEFFYRSRRAGARGLYVPEMVLDHQVPSARLTKRYFRRWWYWKGVSHARLHRLHGETELGLQLTSVPTVAGIPRYLIGNAVRHLGGWIRATVRARPIERTQHAVGLAYVAGYCRECRSGPRPLASASGDTVKRR